MIKRITTINGSEVTLQINGLTVTLFIVNGDIVDVVNFDFIAFLGICWFALYSSWFGLRPMLELRKHKKSLAKQQLALEARNE